MKTISRNSAAELSKKKNQALIEKQLDMHANQMPHRQKINQQEKWKTSAVKMESFLFVGPKL